MVFKILAMLYKRLFMSLMPITAIILAGGQSSRMNRQNKGLQLLHGNPLYYHVINKIKPQVNHIVINCNQDIEQYQQSGYPVIVDELIGFLGPLAGIFSGLITSSTDWNLVVSCDTPFLPDDLVKRLQAHCDTHLAAYVFDGEKSHPTLMLIHRQLAPMIKHYLLQGKRKLLGFLQQIDAIQVDFSDKPDVFININTLEQLAYWNQKQCK